MKNIEKRAQEYCEKNLPILSDMHFAIATAYEAGADDRTRLMTKWHDAKKELPTEDKEVLAMIHRKFQTYTVLRYDGEFWLQPIMPIPPMMEDGGWIGIAEEVIAWREIHE